MHTAVAPAPPPAAARPDAPARRIPWGWAGLLGGAGILAVLLWRLGTGPFLDGVRQLDGRALAAALGLGVLTTAGCAWRWSLIAGGLGLRLPLRTALAACYRSVFLNATLPGGVLGDVDRAVHFGRAAGDVGRGIRSVVWDRTAGQVVQAVLAVLVLLTLPSPVRSAMPAVTVVALAVALAVLVLSRPGVSGWARAVQADLRAALLAPRTRVPIVLASVVVVSGHVATFVVAARVAGATASVPRLLPLALLALVAMAVPLNVAGFGPREGVAAWAFGAGGLTAAQGVATGIAYGVLVLVASLPGAAVLLIGRSRD